VLLAAALPPALERALQPSLVLDRGEHLHRTPALGLRAQAHEVELAGVADPGGPMQRALGSFTPPQADILLAGVDATVISGVEAGE
jgi:hypothetical protein